MTAAHCVLDDNPNKYTVILGDVDQYKNEGLEQEFQVNRIIKHPSYSHPVPYENDIALFQLKKPAQRSDAVNTACLPGFLEEAPVGMECYISGGRTKSITVCNCMSGPLLWQIELLTLLKDESVLKTYIASITSLTEISFFSAP